MSTDQESTCPECGAPRVDGMTCWEQLGAVLAWEWQDPELAAQHFLTVASYNLQHPAQFTDAALAGLRTGLVDYLDHGVTTKELRRRMKDVFDGPTRVRKKETEQHTVLRQWPLTIDHVYIPNQPAGAAERVKAWAASIRAEFGDD